MTNSNETISENIENEILSQEDQISKNGGVNVTLEDFLTSTTKTIHNKTITEEEKNDNLIYTDDSKNNFNNFKIEESINLNIDNRVNNNELLESTSNDKLRSDNNTNLVESKDIDTNNIIQNRTIDEVKILDTNISYDASNILKDMESISSETDAKIETKQTNNNADTISRDSSEEISNTKVTLTNIESSSYNETEEETIQTEDNEVIETTVKDEEITEIEDEKIETKEDEEITEIEDAKVETTQVITEDVVETVDTEKYSLEAQNANEIVFTKDDIKVEEQIDNIKEKNPNNGKGNGDQDAPGNSLEHNNAENAMDDTYKLSDHIEFNIDNIIVEQKEISKEEEPQEIFAHEVMNIPENNSSFEQLTSKKEQISHNHKHKHNHKYDNESENNFIDKESFSGFEEMHRIMETHIHVD